MWKEAVSLWFLIVSLGLALYMILKGAVVRALWR